MSRGPVPQPTPPVPASRSSPSATSPPPARKAPSGRAIWLILGLILASGFALRCWYLSDNLTYERFWDERYSFENVRSILQTGSLKPAKSYYPSPLVSWPQAGLVAGSEAVYRTTGWRFFHAYADDGFRPAAFLWVRLLTAVYGVAGLLMTFLVGRQLFSTRAALLGTTLMTFMPWHIHASAKFKPDALLVFTVLLAFYLSVRAVREQRLAPYLWAGVAIALALSSKLTGGLVALPLVAATALLARIDRRRIKWLFAAGVTSLAAFFALNPYGWAYVHFVRSLQTDYAMRAEGAGMTRASMPVELLRYLTGPFVHGRWLGVLALLAFIAFAFLVAKGSARRTRVEGVMFLVFPITYAVAYLAATPYFKGNNLLPVLPFSSLLVAWALIGLWRRARAWLPAYSVRLAAAAGLVAVLALGVAPGFAYVYRGLTPTTWDVAVWHLERGLKGRWGRSVYRETYPQPVPRWEGESAYADGRALVITVDRLAELDPKSLDASDGEVFLERRLAGDEGAFYRDRVTAARGGEIVIRPRWLETRGPALVAIPRPLRSRGSSQTVAAGACGPGCARFEWADGSAPRHGLVSAVVSLPVTTALQSLTLEAGERRVELFRVASHRGRANFGSRRFAWRGEPLRVTSGDGALPDDPHRVELSMLSWGRPRRR